MSNKLLFRGKNISCGLLVDDIMGNTYDGTYESIRKRAEIIKLLEQRFGLNSFIWMSYTSNNDEILLEHRAKFEPIFQKKGIIIGPHVCRPKQDINEDKFSYDEDFDKSSIALEKAKEFAENQGLVIEVVIFSDDRKEKDLGVIEIQSRFESTPKRPKYYFINPGVGENVVATRNSITSPKKGIAGANEGLEILANRPLFKNFVRETKKTNERRAKQLTKEYENVELSNKSFEDYNPTTGIINAIRKRREIQEIKGQVNLKKQDLKALNHSYVEWFAEYMQGDTYIYEDLANRCFSDYAYDLIERLSPKQMSFIVRHDPNQYTSLEITKATTKISKLFFYLEHGIEYKIRYDDIGNPIQFYSDPGEMPSIRTAVNPNTKRIFIDKDSYNIVEHIMSKFRLPINVMVDTLIIFYREHQGIDLGVELRPNSVQNAAFKEYLHEMEENPVYKETIRTFAELEKAKKAKSLVFAKAE